MTPFFNAPSLRSGNCFFLINKRKLDIPPKEAIFLWFSNSQKIVGVFFGKLFPRFFAPKLKGFHMVLQACHSEAIAFLLWALFGGVWNLSFWRLSSDFGKSLSRAYCFHIWRLMAQHLCLQTRLSSWFASGWAPDRSFATIFGQPRNRKKAIVSPSKPHTN